MDFARDKNMTPKSSRMTGDNTIDMTILSTPRPQATSTVERRTFDSQCSDGFMQWRQQPINTTEDYSDLTNTSSLGLLNDISSRSLIEDNGISTPIESNKYETQRKMARQLLARLSEQGKQNSFETDKENNVNTQNLGEDLTPSTLINSIDVCSPRDITKTDKSALSTEVPKISINSVVFEPNEITGRSSEKSRSPESPSKYKIDGFSFNSTAAEIMAKFTNEDFISGSQMNSQLLADENSWQQNYNPIPPGTTDNERLEFSCFSGIMGELDLSVGSCRKVSVDEFFRRKCEPIGQLSSDYSASDRPNFGFEIKSPKRLSKPGPLVNLTMMTEASGQSEAHQQSQNVDDKFMTTCGTSCIDDVRDDDIDDDYDDDDDDDDTDRDHEQLISLSGIAKALDSNDKTPRRLVDHLLKVKKKEKEQKKEKKPVENGNCTGGTYTLTTARSSLPSFSLNTPRKSMVKLSLDGINSNNSTMSHSITRAPSIPTSSFNFENKYLNPRTIGESETPKSPATSASSPSFYDKETIKQLVSKRIMNNNEEILSTKTETHSLVKTDNSIKREISSPGNIQANNTIINKQKERLSIGKNSEGLYKCIIGVLREAEIEMINESDRWLVCTLNLMQIQGDKSNVHLEIPKHEILIEPSKGKTVRIIVKLLKMTGPVLAALSINCKDMTTRESFTKQHMMCFIPANAQVDIICPPGHFNQLNFSLSKNITELPVTLHNNYDTDVPLELSVSDDKGLFSLKIQGQEETITSDKLITYLILKANEKSVVNVEYKGTKNSKDSAATSETSVKLIVRVFDEVKNGAVLGEIPLIVEADEDKDSSEETRNSRNNSRCNTPQQQLLPSLPSSPHSVSSTTSTGTSASACNKSGRASPRSLSSGVTVTGDTIPIQSTHSSLSWTTVKVGKYEIKEFTIRNTSNNKIKLQAVVTDSDKNFKFLKDRESSTSIIVGLQKMESRTLSIVFSPNKTGALAGKITFMHYDNKIKKSPDDSLDRRDSRPSRVIMLYGCGGYARVNINQALKIMAGQMWLSLGQLNSAGSLNSKVQLQNLGDLPAYAKIKLTPKAVYPTMETSWHVEPTEFILGPKQSRWITIEFKPRKEDIVLLKGDVADMGTLTITHGDEPTRWRIRRLYQKLIETGQINRKENDVFKNVVDPICKKFPGEVQMPNLSIIRDCVQELGVLCRNVNRHVVTLMMELNSDETLSIFTDDGDDSEMFQSLCSDTSVVFINNEDSYMPSESLLDKTVTNEQPMACEEEFTVSPSVVTLNPPGLNEASVMITSTSSTAQPFETKLLNNDHLSVLPAGGMIPAKRGVLIKIQCKKNIDKNFESALQIFTSNERRTVKIKVAVRRY